MAENILEGYRSEAELSTLVELFKNLNDGAGRSKYLHYVQDNEKEIYFYQIFTIATETILLYNILKYIYIYSKIKTLDKFIRKNKHDDFVQFCTSIIQTIYNQFNEIKLKNSQIFLQIFLQTYTSFIL